MIGTILTLDYKLVDGVKHFIYRVEVLIGKKKHIRTIKVIESQLDKVIENIPHTPILMYNTIENYIISLAIKKIRLQKLKRLQTKSGSD